jgi:F0F1-type ATP synthase membrane subunit a
MFKKTRNYLTKFVIFLAVFMTASNMISMFFKNATTSDWILTIVISLIASYQHMD